MALTKVPGTLIADSTITSTDILDSTITNAKLAVDPANASNLSSGDVPAAQLDNVPTEGLQGDIALLAFKTQANGNLARYNLVDQSVDAFEDGSGVDAAASTNDARSGTGKYYSGAAGGSSGGTEVTSGSYVYHTFLADSNLTVTGTLTGVEYLVVAGGGGGGGQTSTNWGAGGGGAGGYRSITGQTITAGTHAVVVGDGGAGGAAGGNLGVSGGVSSFNSLESAGGAGGDAFNVTATTGGSGAGGAASTGTAGNTPSTSPAQGFAGGNAYSSSPSCGDECSGGGGGGATEAGGWTSGGRESDVNGGAGSNAHSAWATITSTGASGYYAGGGGGGTGDGSPSVSNTGGAGGGGTGGVDTDGAAGSDATANTGGGGGGGSHDSGPGGAGGKGIVIIRRGTQPPANMTLESITTTTATAPTKGDLVFTYTNGAGTAVVGTNITAEYSADAGSTWTDFGIAAADTQGTTGGHTIVTKNNVSLTSTSGTNMRYRIKTLVQSASLDTRIHAVSLGWS